MEDKMELEIISTSMTPQDKKVLLNGQELRMVQKIEFKAAVGDINTAIITFIPTKVRIKTKAKILQKPSKSLK